MFTKCRQVNYSKIHGDLMKLLQNTSEKLIFLSFSISGQSLQELGKEKTSQKAVENNTQQFLKSLNIIETKLSEQINYLTQVSTGQPHEGSGYASAKVLQMAWHRIQHARSRVRELDESKNKYVHAAARHQRQSTGHSAPLNTAAPSPTQPTAQQNSPAIASSAGETSSISTPSTPTAPSAPTTTSVSSPAPSSGPGSVPTTSA